MSAAATKQDDPQAFPLAWPVGWERTKRARREPPYRVSLAAATHDLMSELKMAGARYVTISTNVPLRRDGLPRSDHEPTDPGAAVYWLSRDGKPMVMACDCWCRVRGNVRALGMAVAALRAIERSGASQLLERAYSGFAALPANAQQRGWREVLGFAPHDHVTKELLHLVRRSWVAKVHPDAGGSHEQMAEINRAYDQALRELGL